MGKITKKLSSGTKREASKRKSEPVDYDDKDIDDHSEEEPESPESANDVVSSGDESPPPAKKGKGRPKKSESRSRSKASTSSKSKSKTKSKSPAVKKLNVESTSEDESHYEGRKDKEISPTKSKKSGGRGRPAKSPTPKPKKVKSESEPEDEDNTKEYEVEKILEVRHHKNGKREFQIKWKGFGMHKSTWEPEDNLDCQDMVKAFLAKVDADDLSRTGRLRATTERMTRASASRQLERVKSGRVTKSRSRSRVPVKQIEVKLVEEVNRINGEIRRSREKTEELKPSEMRVFRRRGHGVLKALTLSCGMAVSIGAALLLSSSSSISFDQISRETFENLNYLRNVVIGEYWY